MVKIGSTVRVRQHPCSERGSRRLNEREIGESCGEWDQDLAYHASVSRAETFADVLAANEGTQRASRCAGCRRARRRVWPFSLAWTHASSRSRCSVWDQVTRPFCATPAPARATLQQV